MRKQSFSVRCDGDGCNAFADVETLNHTPANWYHVGQANDQDMVPPRTGFDLCSERCVEKWAKGRRTALAGTNGVGKHQVKVICPECTTEIGVQGFLHHWTSQHPDEEMPAREAWVYA